MNGLGGGLALRLGAASDASAAARLLETSLPEAWNEASLDRILADGSCLLVLAERVGSVEGSRRLEGVALASVVAELLQVLQVAVAEDRRREGLGAAVLRRLEAEAIARGATAGWLEVRAGNTAAVALYRGSGWELVGERSGYYRDGEDALLLSRQLVPPGP